MLMKSLPSRMFVTLISAEIFRLKIIELILIINWYR